ncbi:MAG: hypothetical protein LBH16_00105 [Treponema sp.]|jgi:hypothetical protein|nr:hypothetical protein [Treponema sp.]
MKKFFIIVIFFILLQAPLFQLTAQTSSSSTSSSTSPSAFDPAKFPQWVKDMRRWDIIAFGAFPFAMFTITFFTDMYRWYDNSGLDFSETGRRYAPWPLKSAGAVEMTKDEYVRTIWLAAGLSASIAVTDLIIHKIKTGKERRRVESRPSGVINIKITPSPPPDATETAVDKSAEENPVEEKTGDTSGNEKK